MLKEILRQKREVKKRISLLKKQIKEIENIQIFPLANKIKWIENNELRKIARQEELEREILKESAIDELEKIKRDFNRKEYFNKLKEFGISEIFIEEFEEVGEYTILSELKEIKEARKLLNPERKEDVRSMSKLMKWIKDK